MLIFAFDNMTPFNASITALGNERIEEEIISVSIVLSKYRIF